MWYRYGRGPKIQVPVIAPMASGEPLPSGLTDLELFRKFCLPMGNTDLWQEVPRMCLCLIWGGIAPKHTHTQKKSQHVTLHLFTIN